MISPLRSHSGWILQVNRAGHRVFYPWLRHTPPGDNGQVRPMPPSTYRELQL